MSEPASFLISIRELEESLVIPSSARFPLASEPWRTVNIDKKQENSSARRMTRLVEYVYKQFKKKAERERERERERKQSIDAILN